jgi:hypothetical protein
MATDLVGSLQEATRTMLQWQHRNLRTVVNSLSAEALNWTPVPGANAIAAIVVHTLDGERELAAAAAGIIVEHDGTVDRDGRVVNGRQYSDGARQTTVEIAEP